MKYVCQVCGYIYDEEREKIPFSNLPDEWKCPLCGAAKSDFAPEQRKGPLKKEEPAPIPPEDERFAQILHADVRNSINQKRQNFLAGLRTILLQLLLKLTMHR